MTVRESRPLGRDELPQINHLVLQGRVFWDYVVTSGNSINPKSPQFANYVNLLKQLTAILKSASCTPLLSVTSLVASETSIYCKLPEQQRSRLHEELFLTCFWVITSSLERMSSREVELPQGISDLLKQQFSSALEKSKTLYIKEALPSSVERFATQKHQDSFFKLIFVLQKLIRSEVASNKQIDRLHAITKTLKTLQNIFEGTPSHLVWMALVQSLEALANTNEVEKAIGFQPVLDVLLRWLEDLSLVQDFKSIANVGVNVALLQLLFTLSDELELEWSAELCLLHANFSCIQKNYPNLLIEDRDLQGMSADTALERLEELINTVAFYPDRADQVSKSIEKILNDLLAIEPKFEQLIRALLDQLSALDASKHDTELWKKIANAFVQLQCSIRANDYGQSLNADDYFLRSALARLSKELSSSLKEVLAIIRDFVGTSGDRVYLMNIDELFTLISSGCAFLGLTQYVTALSTCRAFVAKYWLESSAFVGAQEDVTAVYSIVFALEHQIASSSLDVVDEELVKKLDSFVQHIQKVIDQEGNVEDNFFESDFSLVTQLPSAPSAEQGFDEIALDALESHGGLAEQVEEVAAEAVVDAPPVMEEVAAETVVDAPVMEEAAAEAVVDAPPVMEEVAAEAVVDAPPVMEEVAAEAVVDAPPVMEEVAAEAVVDAPPVMEEVAAEAVVDAPPVMEEVAAEAVVDAPPVMEEVAAEAVVDAPPVMEEVAAEAVVDAPPVMEEVAAEAVVDAPPVMEEVAAEAAEAVVDAPPVMEEVAAEAVVDAPPVMEEVAAEAVVDAPAVMEEVAAEAVVDEPPVMEDLLQKNASSIANTLEGQHLLGNLEPFEDIPQFVPTQKREQYQESSSGSTQVEKGDASTHLVMDEKWGHLEDELQSLRLMLVKLSNDPNDRAVLSRIRRSFQRILQESEINNLHTNVELLAVVDQLCLQVKQNNMVVWNEKHVDVLSEVSVTLSDALGLAQKNSYDNSFDIAPIKEKVQALLVEFSAQEDTLKETVDEQVSDTAILESFHKQLALLQVELQEKILAWSLDVSNKDRISEVLQRFHMLKGTSAVVNAFKLSSLGSIGEQLFIRFSEGMLIESSHQLFVHQLLQTLLSTCSLFQKNGSDAEIDIVSVLQQGDALLSAEMQLFGSKLSSQAALTSKQDEENLDEAIDASSERKASSIMEGIQPEVAKTADAQAGIPQAEVVQTADAQAGIPQAEVAQTADAQAEIPQPEVAQTANAQAEIPQPEVAKTANAQAEMPQPEVAQTANAQAEISQPEVAQTANVQAGIPQAEVLQAADAQVEIPQAEVVQAADAQVEISQAEEEPVDEELLEAFLEELRDLQLDIQKDSVKWFVDLNNADLLGNLRRYFHTIKGSSSFVNAYKLSALGALGEKIFIQLMEEDVSADQEYIEFLQRLMLELASISMQFQLSKSESDFDISEITNWGNKLLDTPPNLDAQTNTLLPTKTDPEPFAVEAHADRPQEVTPEVALEMDPEILEAFFDELLELQQEIYDRAAIWYSSRSDTECMRVLKRCFHTIKGSSSQVGAVKLSRLGQLGERFFELLLDIRDVSKEDVAFFQRLLLFYSTLVDAFHRTKSEDDIDISLIETLFHETTEAKSKQYRSLPVIEDMEIAQTEIEEIPVLPPTPAVEEPLSGLVDSTEIPEEIFSIFFDELLELQRDIQVIAVSWYATIGNLKCIVEMKRLFHTIKGSSTFVMAYKLSQLGSIGERIFERIASTKLVGEEHVRFIQRLILMISTLTMHFQSTRNEDAVDISGILEIGELLLSSTCEDGVQVVSEDVKAPFFDNSENASISSHVPFRRRASKLIEAATIIDPELLHEYLDQMLDVQRNIQSTVLHWYNNTTEVRNVARLRRYFHTIKGNAALVGAMRLSDIGSLGERFFASLSNFHHIKPSYVDFIRQLVMQLASLVLRLQMTHDEDDIDVKRFNDWGQKILDEIESARNNNSASQESVEVGAMLHEALEDLSSVEEMDAKYEATSGSFLTSKSESFQAIQSNPAQVAQPVNTASTARFTTNSYNASSQEGKLFQPILEDAEGAEGGFLDHSSEEDDKSNFLNLVDQELSVDQRITQFQEQCLQWLRSPNRAGEILEELKLSAVELLPFCKNKQFASMVEMLEIFGKWFERVDAVTMTSEHIELFSEAFMFFPLTKNTSGLVNKTIADFIDRASKLLFSKEDSVDTVTSAYSADEASDSSISQDVVSIVDSEQEYDVLLLEQIIDAGFASFADLDAQNVSCVPDLILSFTNLQKVLDQGSVLRQLIDLSIGLLDELEKGFKRKTVLLFQMGCEALKGFLKLQQGLRWNGISHAEFVQVCLEYGITAGVQSADLSVVDSSKSTQAENNAFWEKYDDYDAELVKIFFDESDDLLETIDKNIYQLSHARDNRIFLEKILRALHTLKGSARVAHFLKMASEVHNIETFLTSASDQEDSFSDIFLEKIFQKYNAFLSAYESLKKRQLELTSPTSKHANRILGNNSNAPISTDDQTIRVAFSVINRLFDLLAEHGILKSRVVQTLSDLMMLSDKLEVDLTSFTERLRSIQLRSQFDAMSSPSSSNLKSTANQGSSNHFDALEMDNYNDLYQEINLMLEEMSVLHETKGSIRTRLRDIDNLVSAQSRIGADINQELMRTRMVSFSRAVPRLSRLVRQTASELNKEVFFDVEQAIGDLDRDVLDQIIPSLEHIIRNAIDHGIELPSLREKVGKAKEGKISISLQYESQDVLVIISDDGRGIDLEHVRKKAIELSLIEPSVQHLSTEQVCSLILTPGFSTAGSLSHISGRGVGMDVVNANIKQIGGSVTLSTRPGYGTTFLIRLPFKVSVTRALMIQVGSDSYALPLNSLEGIIRIDSQMLAMILRQAKPELEYAGVSYTVRYLGDLINKRYESKKDVFSVPLVLVRLGDRSFALFFDSVQCSREIMIKSLGNTVSNTGEIAGAAILGDGHVVVVLDLFSLLRKHYALEGKELLSAPSEQKLVQEQGGGNLEQIIEEETPKSIRVMVVDDSLTVRKITHRFLNRHGIDAILAVDGQDAVTQLAQLDELPDLMLLDIEMPNMDGFEVARSVRSDPRLADLPIVMVSSRMGNKHQEQARSVGVNRLIGKPFEEKELLGVIEQYSKVPLSELGQ